MPNSTEVVELWSAFKRGDRDAFSSLASVFYEALYNYGTKLTGDHSLVEDCIQDLFFDLWRRRQFVGETDHVKFYLLKALRRRVYFAQKTKEKWLGRDADVEDRVDFVGEFSIETRIIKAETNEFQLKKLKQILSGLSKRQREVIYLKFYQEMDYEQISRMMSINYQSVRNLIHTAIKDLQTAWFVDID